MKAPRSKVTSRALIGAVASRAVRRCRSTLTPFACAMVAAIDSPESLKTFVSQMATLFGWTMKVLFVRAIKRTRPYKEPRLVRLSVQSLAQLLVVAKVQL